MKKLRIGALLAAGALLLTFAGTALATDLGGQTNWEGNGYPIANGCNSDDTAPGQVLWIFTGASDSDVVLHLGADTYTGVQKGNGSWHIISPWFDSAPSGAYVTWTGDYSNSNAVLTISHGCPPAASPSPSESMPVESESVPPSDSPSPSASTPVESESVPPSDSPSPSASASESPSASASESPSASASESPSASASESPSASASSTPSGSVEAETGTPQITPPSTDTVSGSNGSAGNGLPMVLAAASLLLIAALVATPSRKRSRR
jgi:hypothetical protein